jgi:hypothetical protein
MVLSIQSWNLKLPSSPSILCWLHRDGHFLGPKWRLRVTKRSRFLHQILYGYILKLFVALRNAIISMDDFWWRIDSSHRIAPILLIKSLAILLLNKIGLLLLAGSFQNLYRGHLLVDQVYFLRLSVKQRPLVEWLNDANLPRILYLKSRS